MGGQALLKDGMGGWDLYATIILKKDTKKCRFIETSHTLYIKERTFSDAPAFTLTDHPH